MSFSLRRLSYDRISTITEQLTHENGYYGKFPLDVVSWVEVRLRITPILRPGLKREFGVEGFIGSKLDTITIDQDLYWNERKLNRCRFTFAHELAHYYLHEDLYRSAAFKSVEEYVQFLKSIPDEDHSWLEWQGFTFAGLLLVPRWQLKPVMLDTLRAKRAKYGEAQEEMMGEIVAEALGEVCRYFGVSRETLEKRLVKDQLIGPLGD